MFGDRISRSVAVAKECAAVLKSNPTLGFFPVISSIAVIVASLPFIIPIVLTEIARNTIHHYHQHFGVMSYVLMAGLYFVTTFIIIFFNSALVVCAHENLEGRPTTMKFGIDQAIKKVPQILCWAAIASTVGMILRTISERSGLIGQIVVGLVGIAWNLAVFFVVPVLVFENTGPIQAVKDSTAMIKQSFGERVFLGVGLSSIFGLLFLLSIAPIAIAIGFATIHIWPLAIFFGIVTLLYIVVLAVVSSTFATIFQTALYMYCRTGTIPNGFQAQSLQGAFVLKPERRIFGR
jgi:hypothetical protein